MTSGVAVRPPSSDPRAVRAGTVVGRNAPIGTALAGAVATLLLTYAGLGLDHPGWPSLAAAAVAAVAGAWPVHRRAWRGLAEGAVRVELIGSFTMLAALGGSCIALIDGRDGSAGPVAAVVVAVLTTTAERVRSATGMPERSLAWFTGVVLVATLGTLAGWAVTTSVDSAVATALAVLVVACPAAIVGTPPLAVLALRRQAARLGITLAGPAELDRADTVTTLVLDKDRTVTTGALRVLRIEAVEPDHERNLKWFAGALAHGSSEAVGTAVAKLAGRGHLTNFTEDPDRGLSGSIDRHPVRLGRPEWVGITDPGGPGTTIAVEVDGRTLGHIKLVDEVRPEAAAALSRLGELGVGVAMVSDADEEATALLAAEVGIDTAVARATPAERAAIVSTRQARGEVVAYLGGAEPNTAALDAADLPISTTLHGNRGIGMTELGVGQAVRALELARSTSTSPRRMRLLALVLALSPVPLAAAGLLGPVAAGVVAAATSVVAAVVTLLMAPRSTPLPDGTTPSDG